VKEETKEEWVDDGSLPLVDNMLPFFLLDAHEEQATPGTVYLFGKVCPPSLCALPLCKACPCHIHAWWARYPWSRMVFKHSSHRAHFSCLQTPNDMVLFANSSTFERPMQRTGSEEGYAVF
jgi:hypothetical protein